VGVFLWLLLCVASLNMAQYAEHAAVAASDNADVAVFPVCPCARLAVAVLQPPSPALCLLHATHVLPTCTCGMRLALASIWSLLDFKL
jgi:hypothetical protein